MLAVQTLPTVGTSGTVEVEPSGSSYVALSPVQVPVTSAVIVGVTPSDDGYGDTRSTVPGVTEVLATLQSTTALTDVVVLSELDDQVTRPLAPTAPTRNRYV